jgi:hypothetical protein
VLAILILRGLPPVPYSWSCSRRWPADRPGLGAIGASDRFSLCRLEVCPTDRGSDGAGSRCPGRDELQRTPSNLSSVIIIMNELMLAMGRGKRRSCPLRRACHALRLCQQDSQSPIRADILHCSIVRSGEPCWASRGHAPCLFRVYAWNFLPRRLASLINWPDLRVRPFFTGCRTNSPAKGILALSGFPTSRHATWRLALQPARHSAG